MLNSPTSAGTVPAKAGSGSSQSAQVESRHYLRREPAQLLDELVGRQALRPVNHEVFEARVFRLDRLDAVDDLGWGAAEPRLLLHPFPQGRDRSRRSRGAPGAAPLVGVAHKTKRREPLVALVMRRLDPADRLFPAVGEVDAGAPAHVLSQLHRPVVTLAGIVEGAHDVVEDLLAVQ